MTPGFLERGSVEPAVRLQEQQEECVFDWDEARLLRAFSLDLEADWQYELNADGDVARWPLPRRRGQVPEKVMKPWHQARARLLVPNRAGLKTITQI
jgi:hypothetical protein